jgi:DNA helicase II / ATP-dependent DNA helicase PcrA
VGRCPGAGAGAAAGARRGLAGPGVTATARTGEARPGNGEVPAEEEAVLARVQESLGARGPSGVRRSPRYDRELVALRDEIGEARREDVPALIAQMERLHGVSARSAEAEGVLVDRRTPYFGHLRLSQGEPGQARERDVLLGRATFVDAARGVRIVDWRNAPVSQLFYRYPEGSDYEERFGARRVEGEILVRRTVTIVEGTLERIDCPQGIWTRTAGGWVHAEAPDFALGGGEGTATRPRGVLGAAGREQRLDRHLPEIAALIDPRQFDLITARGAGVVVIQGGAGSGKTTIGLHRIAYLAYASPARFSPRNVLVVTWGSALAAYIAEVLPALGVHGVPVVTFADWARKELRRAFPSLDLPIADDAPAVVGRLKSHPALLRELERRGRAHRGRRTSRALLELWAELLTDRTRLATILAGHPGAPLTEDEVTGAHRFMADRVAGVLERDPAERRRGGQPAPADDDVRGETGIDGLRTEDERAVLDLEDVAMLLRLDQLVRGRKRRYAHLFVDEAQDLSPLALSVLIGATTRPDSSPRSPRGPSITLAGDTAQRLFLDNGFTDWRTVLADLGLDHVAVEPLRISYRSTREILVLARAAMGPLADPEPPQAPRSGAPVEAHRFPGTGAAVAFLAEALRALATREPRATVAVLARHPEQADRYHDGLRLAEIPSLRRVRAQDFSFRPGVEVTDIRQVKGLEFDYVVMVDVNASTFGTDDESRHLFHIAATRAAHQLWLLVTAAPSPLIPASLVV